MNLAQLAAEVSERTGHSKADASAIIEATLDSVRDQLAAGGTVRAVGFGTFAVRDKKERPGQNPATGEPMTIPGKRVPVFRPGQNLRDAVADTE